MGMWSDVMVLGRDPVWKKWWISMGVMERCLSFVGEEMSFIVTYL